MYTGKKQATQQATVGGFDSLINTVTSMILRYIVSTTMTNRDRGAGAVSPKVKKQRNRRRKKRYDKEK